MESEEIIEAFLRKSRGMCRVRQEHDRNVRIAVCEAVEWSSPPIPCSTEGAI